MTNQENKTPQSQKSGIPSWSWALLVLAIAVGVFLLRPAANESAGPGQDPASVSSLPRLVDLGSDKCIPCKTMAPILEEIKGEYAGKFDVQFIDIWKDPTAGSGFNVKIIPTQVFLAADGTELFRHEGFYSKEDILAKWLELGIDI